MLTVLVTGANGFVGSHALEALMETPGTRPIAACRDRAKLLPTFNGEVREGDISDPAYLNRLLDGVDVICHAAAWSSVWGHAEESRRLFLEPTLALMAACVEKGISRIINVSSTTAAAPDRSDDPMSRGIHHKVWPHMRSIVVIEDYLRDCDADRTTRVNLRFGLFAGRRYGLGLLPLLLPRLKTHLVPWVADGKTSMPIIDGADIGKAMALAATAPGLAGYQSFNVVGPETPSVRQVLEFLDDSLGYPQPHFSVPFRLAYAFGRAMEMLDPIVPWEPLVTRSIVLLLEETNADNEAARRFLGYHPTVHWKDTIGAQIAEMNVRQISPMRMAKPVAG